MARRCALRPTQRSATCGEGGPCVPALEGRRPLQDACPPPPATPDAEGHPASAHGRWRVDRVRRQCVASDYVCPPPPLQQHAPFRAPASPPAGARRRPHAMRGPWMVSRASMRPRGAANLPRVGGCDFPTARRCQRLWRTSSVIPGWVARRRWAAPHAGAPRGPVRSVWWLRGRGQARGWAAPAIHEPPAAEGRPRRASVLPDRHPLSLRPCALQVAER